MFLRAVWVKWLPPMEKASPSPPNTNTCRSGRRKRNAAGEGQRAAVDVMRAVGLHEIRKPAGAADAGDGGDLLVPELALLDQLEVKRQHGEIAAAGTPGGMVGGDFLLGQRLAFGGRGHGRRRDGGEVAGDCSDGISVVICAHRSTWDRSAISRLAQAGGHVGFGRVRGFPSPSRSGRRSC